MTAAVTTGATSTELLDMHTARRTLIVAEKFADSIQGEGVSRGEPAAFVRLSRCNLQCGRQPGSTFVCDTPYTWDTGRFDLREHSAREDVGDVAAWVLDQPAGLVVITGGEPLLQRTPLTELVAALTVAGRRVEVETNGTIDPGPDLMEMAFWNVSAKLSGSGMDYDDRIKPRVLTAFAASGRANFKFVAAQIADLGEVDLLVEEFGLSPVVIMPEGVDAEMILSRARLLVDPIYQRGWRLTLRDHILLWGNTPGK